MIKSVVKTIFLIKIEMGLGPPPARAIISVIILEAAANTPKVTRSRQLKYCFFKLKSSIKANNAYKRPR